MEEKKFTIKEQRELRNNGVSGCQCCGQVKPLSQIQTKGFYPNGKQKYGPLCFICYENSDKRKNQLEYLTQWRKDNPDYMKNWEDGNQDRIEYIKEYNNKPENRLRKSKLQNERFKKLYSSNKEFKFYWKMRDHLKGVKNRQDFKDLWDDVREVYDFYNITYHIDHKVPQSWFIYHTPIDLVNSIDNLHLIDGDYNLKKNNKWSDPVPSDYLDKIRPYIKKEFQGLLKSL